MVLYHGVLGRRDAETLFLRIPNTAPPENTLLYFRSHARSEPRASASGCPAVARLASTPARPQSSLVLSWRIGDCMKLIAWLLVPAALSAGQARYARLGEFEGHVEVQLQAADSWMAAERNLPLVESSWLRTAASSRLEIEVDEGSAWRLGPDSQGEISDYSRPSTGQRLTLHSLDLDVA